MNKTPLYCAILIICQVILPVFAEEPQLTSLTIEYPLDGTLFPSEIIAPLFRWKDSNKQTDTWLVTIEFSDSGGKMDFTVSVPNWKPEDSQWEEIKRRSLEKDAKIIVRGVNKAAQDKILSEATISIKTSQDKVGAALIYREVPLPFKDAVKDPSRICWRLGEVSSKTQPPVILDKLPVCGNCHSFSADTKVLGMDVDYASDKGSYVITGVSEEITLDRSKIITWGDYKREDREQTFGLLSQVSPDGKYVVSTVKDRSVFVATDDLAFSQLFFPIKGILAVYSLERKAFKALPGADNKEFVQSNPSWSPDGRYIVFARSKAYQLKNIRNETNVLLTPAECSEFLEGGKTFLFDLYRIPFNDGKGGEAQAIEGAFNNGMSNFFAKYSPDGKWIVFCKAKSFMLLQPDSELYIIPAKGGQARRMRCNTNKMNSWHSWSPNSRWLVFASKGNTIYTQLFLTHIDEEGNDTPPVLLAQFTSADRAANIPEFINAKASIIKKIHEKFVDDVSFARAGAAYGNALDYAGAEQAYRRALEINPNNPEAHIGLAIVMEAQGKLDEAITHYKETIKLDPAHTGAHHNLGNVLVRQGKIEEGVFHYKEAIKINPKFAEAYHNLAIIFEIQGKFEEAVFNYNEAIKINPNFLLAHLSLADFLEEQGRLEEATIQNKEVLRIDPKFAAGYNSLGNIAYKQGKLAEAKAYYGQALKLKPGVAAVYANLGAISERQGDLQAALNYYNEALKINPALWDAHNSLGNVLEMQGKLYEAVGHYKEAIRLNPKAAIAYNDIGCALTKQGKFDEAVVYLKEAIRLEPKAAIGYINLAVVLEKQGKIDEAINQCQEALKVDPEFRDAHSYLKELFRRKEASAGAPGKR